MDESDLQRVQEFLKRWQGLSGDERANKDSFFLDLCKALDVEPPPAKGSIADDPYCFEKDVKIPHPSGKVTTCFVDFYKQGHFVIEAKQGGEVAGKGTAKRGTASYLKEMEKAFVQGLSYTRHLDPQPPFLITCDIGSHFEIWLGFNGDYGGYGARRTIPLIDFQKPDIFALFVDIFTDPQKRNPEKIAARVTREVAADLAVLARSLESNRQPQEVASFLMRCIFTMFAEDVGLLPEKLFTEALKERWIPKPKTFQPEVEALWQAMNDGTSFGFSGKLLKFNGGLFADASAFPLNGEQLEVLLQASQRDWSQVEPAIFGTLLERALDAKERSKLGAHYTPRSYVERLVRPVILEPIREQWELVQAEVKQTLENAGEEPTKKQVKNAIALIQDFLQELREIKILDPACGSGNFLYVTLDLLKGLESEVLRRLADITSGEQLSLDFDRVNPSQFLGIELNPRAAAIADLVIWIGYLQWHFKRFGDIPPIEPVLRAYNNIECRDAVLDYDSKEPAFDSTTNQPRTRWGGRMMRHPVTGENVPDPSDQIPIYKFINPRSAEWQEANYIVSNPPFIGNARMREVLGDGYAETLRQVYQDVPDTVDFVMYWWHKAAELVRLGKVARFGFITTNSIRQVRQRKVIDFHRSQKKSIRLIFAIPDHPWVDGGAAVRIAMTAAELDDSKNLVKIAQLGTVISENEGETPEDSADLVEVRSQNVGQIFSDLRTGINIASATALKAQSDLCCTGVKVYGSGFIINYEELKKSAFKTEKIIRYYRNGRDVTQKSRNVYVIDCFGLTQKQLQESYPEIYQFLLERVYPDRSVERDKKIKDNWWLFERNRPELRKALESIQRYIVTVETAKQRVFSFLDSSILPDVTLIVIPVEDSYFLGVLSSRIHVTWTLATGGTLEDRPRYNKTKCFDPFPFPDSTPEQKQTIRELGEKLDNHRKKVQSQHPEITITGMYNLLEKLRAGEPFTEADKTYNNKALVSTLKQIHDELDAAVLEAYGWEKNISDEEILERLVALNVERSAEERNGLIRWLRPEYQAPKEIATQMTLAGITEAEEVITAPAEQKTWPKKPKEQLAAIRDLLRTAGGEWTVEQVVVQFKGATRQKKAISEHLESLEALGILLSRQENNAIRWHHN